MTAAWLMAGCLTAVGNLDKREAEQTYMGTISTETTRRMQCPRPANAVPTHITNWTVLDCLACDECGCDLGDKLRGDGQDVKRNDK